MLLSAVVSIFSLVFPVLGSPFPNPPSRKPLPGAYIFQFEDGQGHDDFDSMLSLQGKTRMTFDYKLFKGVSVQLDDVENADEKAFRMSTSGGIKNTWPVEVHSLPADDIAWIGTPSKDMDFFSKRDGSCNKKYSTHVMTQIDKLHAKGYKGKGVKIAVIDTGVDYNHPALGGCLGEGCVITRGYDLVGDDYDGYNQPVPDDDPMDCLGHGTHVTGILAAQKNDFGIVGAAPDAEVWLYKVFGCQGNAANDILVAAIYKAFEDGPDIISASIGVMSGWSDEFFSAAAADIVSQGTPCIFGASNEGQSGMWKASSAAAGTGVAAVGSVENTLTPTLQYISEYIVDGREARNFSYTIGFPEGWDGVELPLWAADGNVCDYPDPGLPDLSEVIVLIPRGDCPVERVADSLVTAGAQYFIAYSDGKDAPAFYLDDLEDAKAMATISSNVRSAWMDALKEGSEVLISMTGRGKADTILISPQNHETGGAISSFSSWGPTWDLEEVKPSFSAPGGWILSTVPMDMGGYAVRSGTSMATPLVAGAYALVSQVRGTTDPKTLRNLFSATSDPLNFHDTSEFSDFLAPVPQQGGGLIRAYDAAFATTLLEPSQLSFGDTPNLKESLNFTLVNEGKKEVTYEISHVPTMSVYTYNGSSIYPAEFPNELFDEHVSLSFSETKVILSPGDTLTVDVTAAAENIDTDRLPVWSGWVIVNGTDGTSLSLPYQGVSGSLRDQTVLASDSAWISSSEIMDFKGVADETEFTLPRPGSTPESPPVLPVVAVLMALGTTTLRADVVALDKGSDLPSEDFFGTETIGQIAQFPRRYTSRNGYPEPWNGMLDSGEYAPEGRYKIVMRALRIFGDPEKGDDWDVAEAGTLRIKYA